ncbi:CD164 sialomucin-like 2 protein [Bombina bombina]|uniref:CD164 sialomucin-like 2 protein n=1 Tax=Bombina bombina TaxID=8345 RepID=UPI00235A696B|nr:CD164 sialomucin-like 2 protein [Bombina bombina]XP_053563035.1 CD164 sialomucin-like 2 protein [Bombina bombina]
MMRIYCALVFISSALSLCRAEACSHLGSCISCMEGEPALNISCKWITCGPSENSSCISHEKQPEELCRISNTSSMCTVPEKISTEMSPEDGPEPPASSHPVFHTGSFIGGGLLVIILQVIGYFVLRSLRGTERDYQTMEDASQ